jgi:tRNA(Arg) A34 adenosine deaminase TadA
MSLAVWDNLSLPWQVSLEEAWVAYCSGAVPIGAAVTDSEGHIIGRGRNRIAGDNSDAHIGVTRVAQHELAHAELNALLSLNYAYDEVTPQNDPHKWHLYTTMEPCPLCLGAFYMSGLRQLHYAARDSFAGSVNLLGTTPYLSRKPIQVYGPVEALENVSVALVVESMLRDSPADRSQFLLDHWRKVVPMGVALGEHLLARQILSQLQAANATVAEMFVRVSQPIEK